MSTRLQHLGLALALAFCNLAQACGDGAGTPGSDTTQPDDNASWYAPPPKACSADADCADDDACTWDEGCGDDGFCAFRILACDDQNDCTSDTCDSAQGCLFEAFEGACDDGNPCTLGDHCAATVCLPADTVACDDGNPCTQDRCDANDGGACRFEPLSNLAELGCDDGDACTEDGRCDAGRCVYDAVQCPSDSTCQAWSCDAAAGCVATALAGPCNDGDVCTTGDTCAAGACVGGPALDCGDGDPCTDDLCVAATGCSNPANTAPCDDGVACTGADRCDAGVCRGGPADCDDANPCTLDLCDGANGCKYFPAVGPCDDGDACTLGDHCADGACVAGGADPCDDGKTCTSDTCTPNNEVAVCGHATVASCLTTDVAGSYYGLFHFGFDATASDPTDFDCLGTAVATLVEGAPAVVTGSASCRWDLAVAVDKAVLMSFTARESPGNPVFVQLGGVNVAARAFAGSLTTAGALAADLPVTVYVTTTLGNPNVLVFADGTATAPPANQPKAVSITVDVAHSNLAVPLCCHADDTCFPGGAALCASVGAAPVAPADSGPCCLATPGGGETCVDTPASWCAATADAVYKGPKPSACCLATGCATLSQGDCEAAGGTYRAGLGCDDGDSDGFADVCPAPPGCGQPGVATCTRVGDVLTISPFGFQPVTLRGSWTTEGAARWSTYLPFFLGVGGVDVPIPVIPPALVEVSCEGGAVAVTGTLGIPDLAIAGFDFSSPEAEAPYFTLGFGLGQDLASLDAPLADCRTYAFFEGSSHFSVGSGDDASVLNDGSTIVLAVDPLDPAFYARAEGQILDGPTGGLASRVGFGVSRGGHLKWTSDFPVPPAPGQPPVGATVHGHVYATADMGVIPIAGSPVQIEVDGEAVYDLGPYPEAAEAVLAGVLAGDPGAIQATLDDLGDGLTSGAVLDQLAYGVNAHEVRLVIADGGTFTLGRGTLVAADGVVRFAAEVGNLAAVLPEQVPAELATALSKFGVKQLYTATGAVDQSGMELRLVADLTVGPVVLDGAAVTIRYKNGHFSIETELPGISFDLLGWLESFKDFLGCDFTATSASCTLAGYPIGDIAFDTSGGRVRITMNATLPGNMGTVGFAADVADSGDYIFTGTATIPFGPFQSAGATLVLTQDGVRVIGTLAQVSQSMTFDGQLYYDGSFILTGLGSMTMLQFITMQASATLSYCPAGSTCAAEGGVVGDLVLLLTGDVDTPVGQATLQGDLTYVDGEVTYDLQGLADFDVGGYAGLDGTMRVTNRGTPGASLHLDLDLPLLTGTVDGELAADGSFLMSGSGSLDIPGFASLASATIEVSSSRGVHVASSFGVAGASLQFAGRVGPDGFAFTGWNHVNLLGFRLDGQVTFAGGTSGAQLAFDGALDLAGSALAVSGLVHSGGQFSFTGHSSIRLFGYDLSEADVTFDNSGLAISGQLRVPNIATFAMSGEIQNDLDFTLSASATAVTFPGGLAGQLSAGITKQGQLVKVAGAGYATFFGQRANGGFQLGSNGQFYFFGGFDFHWGAGNLDLDGDVRVGVANFGFTASAHGRACADFGVRKGCATVGGSFRSDGKVCVKFPIAGNKCVNIF